jgi:hypothetical protein
MVQISRSPRERNVVEPPGVLEIVESSVEKLDAVRRDLGSATNLQMKNESADGVDPKPLETSSSETRKKILQDNICRYCLVGVLLLLGFEEALAFVV